MVEETDVIITGAGVVGLTLAHALKKHYPEIRFQILEPDVSLDTQDALGQCLTEDVFDRLKTIQVGPEILKEDTGYYLFLNLKTLKPRYLIPVVLRILWIRREGYRKLLAESVDIRWNSKIHNIICSESRSTVRQADGSTLDGKLIVGADESNTSTRRFLCPGFGDLRPLPVLFIGVVVNLTPGEISPILDIYPLTFQGCHPDSGTFVYYSVLMTPESSGSPHYQAQFSLSWIPQNEKDRVHGTSIERLRRMKDLAKPFPPALKEAIDDISEGTEVTEIKLQD